MKPTAAKRKPIPSALQRNNDKNMSVKKIFLTAIFLSFAALSRRNAIYSFVPGISRQGFTF
jgi:hypothetical protein